MSSETRYPRWVLWGACALLVIANVINIAADLGGMGQGAEMVTGINSLIWIPVFGAVIAAFLLWSSYRQIARIFKWLTLVLVAYVGTAFLAHVDWRGALLATFVPRLAWSREYLAMLLGIQLWRGRIVDHSVGTTGNAAEYAERSF